MAIATFKGTFSGQPKFYTAITDVLENALDGTPVKYSWFQQAGSPGIVIPAILLML